jgi:hypothetical protein
LECKKFNLIFSISTARKYLIIYERVSVALFGCIVLTKPAVL